jgi:hypothetical protein
MRLETVAKLAYALGNRQGNGANLEFTKGLYIYLAALDRIRTLSYQIFTTRRIVIIHHIFRISASTLKSHCKR